MEISEKQKLALNLYNSMLDDVSSSADSWKKLLNYSINFLSYTSISCLQMYAQAPKATQCATYKYWTEECGVRITKGAKGILIIKNMGGKLENRYVYDVKDVIAYKNNKIPKPWRPNENTQQALASINVEQLLEQNMTECANRILSQGLFEDDAIIKDTANYIINKKLMLKQHTTTSFDNLKNIPTKDVASIFKIAHTAARDTIRQIRELEVKEYGTKEIDRGRNPENEGQNLYNSGGRTRNDVKSTQRGTSISTLGQIREDVGTIHKGELSRTLQELPIIQRATPIGTQQGEASGGVSEGYIQSNTQSGDEPRGKDECSTGDNVQEASIHTPTDTRKRTKILVIKPNEPPQNIEVVFPFERHDIVFTSKSDDKYPYVKYISTEKAEYILGICEHMQGNLIFEDITNEVTVIREANPTDTGSRTLYGREIMGPFALSFRSEFQNGYCSMYDALEFKYLMMFAETPQSFQTKEDFVKDKLIQNEILRYGSNVEESHARIYTFFDIVKEPKQRIKFLKEEYGWGGHMVGTDLGGSYDELHDGKGIKIDYTDNENDIHMLIPWKDVEKRIDEEIRFERYPVPSETLYERYKQRYENVQKLTETKKSLDINKDDGQISLFDTSPKEKSISIDKAKFIVTEPTKLTAATNNDTEKYTPNISEYLKLKEQHPNQLIGVEVGKMFLFYGEQAKEVANALGRTAIKKDISELGEVYLTGFKTKEFEVYADNLIAKGKSYFLGKLNENNTYECYDEAVSKPQTTLLPTQKTNFTVDELSYPTGKKEKYIANVRAIKLLKSIETDNRLATSEEQQILAQYAGWGGLAEAFDSEKWTDEYKELISLLDETEYKNALSSVNNAHYTPDTVIKYIYKAVENMGFKGGNIFEPACGTGNFFSLQSEGLKNSSKLYGVELDSISGRIAKQLHQNAQISIKGFEQTTFGNNFFDLSIGNVPFGDYKVFDKAYKNQNFLIHDYFIAKMIDSTRPNGLIAVITSKGTMDKENNNVRKYLAQRAELLGAIRLPNNAFRGTANTEVTADILFFKKRDNIADTLPSWVNVGTNESGLRLNQYFIDNPMMMCGEFKEVSGRFGMTTSLLPHDIPLDIDLDYAIETLPKNIYTAFEKQNNDEEKPITIPADYRVKNFTHTVIDGDIYFRENSEMVLQQLGDLPSKRVKGLCKIRDCVQNVINLQLDSCTDETLADAQKELCRVYDLFTEKYGYIDTKANKAVFAQDVDLPLLLSLENIDENKNIVKSAIFTERTVSSQTPVEHVDNAVDGLAVSICEKAKVDIAFIERLSGLSYEEVVLQLGTAIFKNPLSDLSDKYDGWETRDEYLSGNVVEKLDVAKAMVSHHPELQINVDELLKAQPVPLTAGEISAQLGSPWIDKEYFEQFMFELLDTPKYLDIPITYSSYDNSWTIRNKGADRNNVLANQTYGTERMNAYYILEECLNLRTVEVRDVYYEGDKKLYKINTKETYKARAKQELISDKFTKWVYEDKKRRDYLVDKYNRTYNCIVQREYDGSIFSFDGMNPKIKLRKHQKNAVARMVLSGKALLAHEVGAGKTFTYIAGIMEQKRIGLCNKAIITVPNHLTEQQGHDILQLYPAANILVASNKDFSKQNRQKLISKIATGNFDIVILGHSQFEKITMPSEVLERNISSEVEELEIAIREAKSNDSPKYTIKQMETAKKRLEAKLKGLLDDSLKDNVITFDQLGVDYLTVDEAHMFKNCPIYTKMRNVAGISTASSQRAADMMMKVHYMLEQNNRRGVTFATGTPISNSMAEMFIMQKYLQPEELKKRDLYHFDSWAGQFGETSIVSELSPEGDSFRERTRFSKFINMPELMSIFGLVADIKTSEVLNLDVPEVVRHNIVCKASFEQKIAIKKNVPRAKRIRNREVRPDEDNMLKLISDARKIGLDAREILPNASDFKYSKINMAVENIFKIYNDYDDIKGTQVVFCDMSTPKKEFNLYDDMRNKLVSKGVPNDEIAFIHDYKTDIAKDELFENVNSGKVRIIFGSTQKCGAGTNMQKRLIALHHMDCPYRPSDLQQREGRIVRQGNMNKSVQIFTYVTEGSFDSYLWSIVEKKQRFISQIMTNKQIQRTCEDIDETVLNYAEVMALSTGNPIIKEKMELEIEVRKLKMLETDYTNNRLGLKDKIETEYPQIIASAEEKILRIKKDVEKIKLYPQTEDFEITINAMSFDKRVDAGNIINSLSNHLKEGEETEIGTYKGFQIKLMKEKYDNTKSFIQLLGEHTYTKDIGDDAVGTIKRIENMYSSIPDILEATENTLQTHKTNLHQLKLEIEKPFDKEEEFKKKTSRLDEINTELDNIKIAEKEKINTLVFDNGKYTIEEIVPEIEGFEKRLGGEINAVLLDKSVVAVSIDNGYFQKSVCEINGIKLGKSFLLCGLDENDNFCELSHDTIEEYKNKIDYGIIHDTENNFSIEM